jgi:hypothetical protein
LYNRGTKGVAGDMAALAARLRDFETAASARAIQRLADQEIILKLELASFDRGSEEWRELVGALTEYGYSVLTAWAGAGMLRPMASRHGKRGVHGVTKLPEDLHLRDDDAHELVVELLLTSVESFRTKTLMNRDHAKRWDPTRGASITTYFIGRCLMELPDVYVRWARGEGRIVDEIARFEGLGDDGRFAVDPERWAIDTVELGSFFANEAAEIEVMFRLQADGYKVNEIAELLTAGGIEMTEAMVRTRLHRARPKKKRSA